MNCLRLASVLTFFLILSTQSHTVASPRDRVGRNFCDPDDLDCDIEVRRKPVTVVDEKTGLMVIERESDREWNQSPEPKLPFGQIIKLESSFDGQSEYAVFDKNWRKVYPNEYGVVTKWTPDFVQGVSYIKTGCGLLACPFGVVVGGGDTCMEEAIFLTKFASKVQLIHRRDSLRAEKMLQSKLMANKKIEIIWDSVVEEVIGDNDPKNVKGLKIKNVKTNKIDELKIDGLFIAIGHDPATQLFKDQLDMDKEGYLTTKPDSTETNIPGVFAAGDVKDKIFRQAVTAAGMGCMAALEAEKFLSH